MRKIFLFIICVFAFNLGDAQLKANVYPTHWWVGMKNPRIQLMIHIDSADGKIIPLNKLAFSSSTPDIKILKVFHPENQRYLFVDIEIAKNAKPQKVRFRFTGIQLPGWNFDFELKARRKGKGTEYAQGVRSNDFVYLIMPDRFANGDYSNDKVPGMKEQTLNRDSMYHRHGGDLQGVIDHLDYLKDMGVSSVWLTPVLENDMYKRTEHGYAITDHYKVGPRLGGNETYQKLSDELHKRGMKLIQDAVYNHCGLYHFFIEDLPMKDWIHQWPKYTNPNYKDQTLFDPHVAQIDKRQQLDGWFDRVMPDLNQENPYLANFLIQNAIWCVEEFGVDAWRIDTYIYNDLDFMNRCNKALLDEYPKITMFGECWVGNVSNQAYFAQNNFNTKFKSNLIGVKDFQLLFNGIDPAIKNGDYNGMYEVLSGDFMYKDPMNNLIFLDNHDITRFLSEVGEDVDKLKMGIGWLLTERGIPQLYYGTEILLKGIKNPDGLVRGDFWGGWKEDKQNKFTQEGRSEKENEVFNWTRTIANFRKTSSAIKTGKLTQYVPQRGLYSYFRYDNNQTVMVVMNSNNDERTVDTKRFTERTNGFTKARNIVTSEQKDLSVSWTIPGKTIWILELER
jgi:glycosidase